MGASSATESTRATTSSPTPPRASAAKVGAGVSLNRSAEDEAAAGQRSGEPAGHGDHAVPGAEADGGGEARRRGAPAPLRHPRASARRHEHEQDPFSPLLPPMACL